MRAILGRQQAVATPPTDARIEWSPLYFPLVLARARRVVKTACGGDQYGPFNFTLNLEDQGFAIQSDGYYSIEHSIGNDDSTCIELWRQKVGQAPPA